MARRRKPKQKHPWYRSSHHGPQCESDEFAAGPQPPPEPPSFRERRTRAALPALHLQIAALERRRRCRPLRAVDGAARQLGAGLRGGGEHAECLPCGPLCTFRCAVGVPAHKVHARCVSSVGLLRGLVFLGHVLRPRFAGLSGTIGEGGSWGHLAGGVCCVPCLRHDASKVLGGGTVWFVALFRACCCSCSVRQWLSPSLLATG